MEPLLPHFERELAALHELGGTFAARYPRVARRLRPEPGACPDPHVDRLVEGFALLAARVQRQLDDGFPEIAEAFLGMLHPGQLRPIPSATILQLEPDPQASPRRRITVPRHAPVLAPEVRGVRCRFRTAMAVDLWPLAVARAGLERLPAGSGAAAALDLELETPPHLPFPALGAEALTFFLDGEPPLMHLLQELLLFRTVEIQVGAADGPPLAVLPGSALRPVGLEPEEALLDWDDPARQGTRLLCEYFAFPDKFLFVRLEGLGTAALGRLGHRARVRCLLTRFGTDERHLRLLRTLGAAHFKLGCVPAVNLFRHPAAPIRLTHRQPSYPVLPEGLEPEACQVHAIDSVLLTVQGAHGEAAREVPRLGASGPGWRRQAGLHWHASRVGPDGNDRLELVLADLGFRPLRPGPETLSLQLTCSNRHLPQSLPFGGGSRAREDFLLPGWPLAPRARALRKPSPALEPPDRRALRRRIAVQLALDQLPPHAWDAAALREALGLLHRDVPAAASQVRGIHRLHAGPCCAWIPGRAFAAPVRGTELVLTCDEDCFVGANLYLFATLLERFFGQLCGPNAFVRFRLRTCQQEGETARWPPRTFAAPLT
jgi:type VI secretion system protein ImpG